MPKRIDLDRLPSKNIEPVNRVPIKGKVRVKQSKGNFANEIKAIITHLVEESILPSMKNIVFDFFVDGIKMSLFGDSDTRRGREYGDSGRYHNVRSRTQNINRGRSRPVYLDIRSTMSLDDLVFDYQRDAETVLAKMFETMNEYGSVTVGDVYNMVGWKGGGPNEERYGWTSLDKAYINMGRDGYILNLPRPRYFN